MTTLPPFRVNASAYAGARLMRKAAWCIFPAILIIVIFLFAGFSDSRWWFLGLILLFIVYPAGLSFAWMSMVADKGSAWTLRPQIWSINHSEGTITVDFFPYDTTFEEDETPNPKHRLNLVQNDIIDFNIGSRYISFILRDNPLHINLLLLPSKLLQDHSELNFLEGE